MSGTTLSASWVPDASGNWTDGANWSTQVVVIVNGNPTIVNEAIEPMGNYDVTIAPAGSTPFTVTYNTTDAINSLGGSSLVTFDMTGGTLTLAQSAGFAGAVHLDGGMLDAQNGWSIDGGFDLAAGATAQVDAGALIVTNGSLAGTVQGAGNLYLAGGNNFALRAGFAITTGMFELGVTGNGFGSATTLYTNVSYAGDFKIDNYSGNAAVLELNRHTLSLSGTSTLDGAIDGRGTLAVSGVATVSSVGYADFGILNGATLLDTGAITQNLNATLGGTLHVTAGGKWLIAGDGGIANAGGGRIVNDGTFEKSAGTGISTVAAAVTNSGVFDTATGTLQVNGAFANTGTILGAALTVTGAFTAATTDRIDIGSLTLLGGGTLAGHLGGTGTVALDSGAYMLAKKTTLSMGTLDIGNNATLTLASGETFAGAFNLSNSTVAIGAYGLTLTGPATLTGLLGSAGTLSTASATASGFTVAGTTVWRDTGLVTQTGFVDLGAGRADTVTLGIAGIGTYDIAGADALGNPNINVTGLATITNAGLFEMTGTSGYASVFNADFTSTGTIDVVSAGLALDGPNAVLGGKIIGGGSLYLGTGWTLEAGAQVKIAHLENNGVGTLAASNTFANSFLQDGGGTIDLAGHSLTLAAADTLSGAIGDLGTLSLANAGIGNFDAYGATTVVDTGSITQTGSAGLGAGATDTVTLDINAGATYGVVGNQWLGNPNQNTNGVATIANAGLFAVGAGNVLDVWHSNFSNTGELRSDGGLYLIGQTATLAGTLSGAGTLQLADTWSLAASAVVSVASLDNEGAGTLAANLAYGGTYSNGNGAGLDLAGHTLTLAGAATLSGLIGDGGTLSVANGVLGRFQSYGASTVLDTGSITQQGQFDLGRGSTDTSRLVIQAAATYSVTGNQVIGNGNVNDDGVGSISNAGLLQVGAGSELTTFHDNFASTGTLLANGYIALVAQAATLAGTIDGVGQVSLQEGFSLAGGTSLSVATFENASVGTLLGDVTDTGAWLNDAGATLALGGHTLTLSNGGTLGGSLAGGALVVDGGTATLVGGVSLGLASFVLAGAGDLALSGNASYGGAFTAGEATATETIFLAGNTLALSGAATLGAGAITIDGGGTLADSGSVTQTGSLTLGDAAGSGTLNISAGGTWDLTTTHGIAAGAGSSIANAGLFERTGAPGKTVIGAAFTNTGTIAVTKGTLVFSGGFTNTGVIIGTETMSHGTVIITAAAPSAADFWPGTAAAQTQAAAFAIPLPSYAAAPPDWTHPEVASPIANTLLHLR